MDSLLLPCVPAIFSQLIDDLMRALEWSCCSKENSGVQPSTAGSAASNDTDEGVLPSEPDVGRDLDALNRRTWLIEQCLAWGGEQRLRLRLTLAVAPGESLWLSCAVVMMLHAVTEGRWACLSVGLLHATKMF